MITNNIRPITVRDTTLHYPQTTKTEQHEKNNTILTAVTAIVLLATASTKINATDLWGAGCGLLNGYGKTGYGDIDTVGGYSTSAAATSAATYGCGGYNQNTAGGSWDAPGLYGVTGRAFTTNGQNCQIVYGGGFATGNAAVSAAQASFSPGYTANPYILTAFD